MIIWNPWHGCHRISEGCQHCYMYFLDGKRGIDTSKVYRTENFSLPVQRRRDGRFKLPSGMQLYVGLSTDFFVEEADEWRDEAWRIMRLRPDIVFRLLTKRANRNSECLPEDWGDGYENVMLQVTTENQQRADERLSILLDIPARHKGFMAAPLIGEVDVERYLATGQFEEVLCGGENYDGARPCHYEWVKKLSDQCRRYDVTFDFIETGTVFVKDGKTYRIPEKRTQSLQAFKSGLSYQGRKIDFRLTNPEPGIFDMEEYVPKFREHCGTCGSRMTCNGCSDCGSCDSTARAEMDKKQEERDLTPLFGRLARSEFRSRFFLNRKEKDMVAEKGMDAIRAHAAEIVAQRLAPADIPNDGKQTPMRHVHPVFQAQHATGCCCRGCFEKWHNIPTGRQLTAEEQSYAVDVIMEWIRRHK